MDEKDNQTPKSMYTGVSEEETAEVLDTEVTPISQNATEESTDGKVSSEVPMYGFLVKFNPDMSNLEVRNEFTVDGVVYKTPPGMIQLVVDKLATEFQSHQLAMAIVEAMLHFPLKAQDKGVVKEMNFVDFIGKRAAGEVVQALDSRTVQNNILLNGGRGFTKGW